MPTEFNIPSEAYVYVDYATYVDGKRKVLVQVESDSVYLTAKEARKIAKALNEAADEYDADK